MRFVSEGTAVGVVDIDAASAEAVANEIGKAGGKAKAVIGDLLQDEDVIRVVEAV